MKYGSLFSGILGLDLAVETFGYEPAWFCESDKNPRKVIARHRPGVPIHEDVTELDFSEVEPVDLLVGGGFPCQPFSSAGKRKGENDARYLWPEVARAVRVLRPRIVVLENVDTILRFREGAERVCADLAGLGYVGRTMCLRASDVGVPHRRRRWFAVAEPVRRANDGERPRSQSWQRSAVAHNTARESGGIIDALLPTPKQVPSGPDYARASRDGSGHGDGKTSTDANGTGRGQRGQRDRLPATGQQASQRNDVDRRHEIDWGPYGPAIRRWERIFGPAPEPLINGKLSPHFVTWMMGLEQGWTEPLRKTAALKALGNAVVPQQAVAALSALGLPIVAGKVSA